MVAVQVTDAAGLSFPTVKTIVVSDVNDAPTAIQPSASSLAENNAAGALVATLNATDGDRNTGRFAGPFTYALVVGSGDTDNTAFSISVDQLRGSLALPTSKRRRATTSGSG